MKSDQPRKIKTANIIKIVHFFLTLFMIACLLEGLAKCLSLDQKNQGNFMLLSLSTKIMTNLQSLEI